MPKWPDPDLNRNGVQTKPYEANLKQAEIGVSKRACGTACWSSAWLRSRMPKWSDADLDRNGVQTKPYEANLQQAEIGVSKVGVQML